MATSGAANGDLSASTARPREDMGSPGKDRKKTKGDGEGEVDNKDIMLQQILDKVGTIDKLNATLTELQSNSKHQWEMFMATMNKLDEVRKDLDKTASQVSELRKEIETMKKKGAGKGSPSLVADPRIEAMSEEIKKLKSSTIGGCSTRAGSLPAASVSMSQSSVPDRFAASRPMTLVMTWGDKSYKRDEILEAAGKVFDTFKEVGISKPQLKVNGNHARCAFMTFESVRSANTAFDAYFEIELDNKVQVGKGEGPSAVYLNWQRTPIQSEYGRRLNAVVQFITTAKAIDKSNFARKVNQGLLLFQGDRMLRFQETLGGIDMRYDIKVLAKVGITKEQIDAAIQEDAARV
jgi:hypothetical protein